MAKHLVEITQLKNFLGGQWVHSDVNLRVRQGEILAIVGGSGSGKTTLLRCLLMLHQPTEGSIRVFGTEVTDCDSEQALAIQHRWGILFQQNALFNSLTVLENVQFPLKNFTRLPKTLQRELAALKIVMAGLPLHAGSKLPSELSGGMEKRAALARAIALDPELLILDEPTSGLDPQSASAFDELILHLRTELGLTIIMVTHDLDSLWRTADRVAFIGEGKVLATLPIQDLVQETHPLIQAYFSGYRGQRDRKSYAT